MGSPHAKVVVETEWSESRAAFGGGIVVTPRVEQESRVGLSNGLRIHSNANASNAILPVSPEAPADWQWRDRGGL